MQIDGISSIPPISSISAAQRPDGPVSRVAIRGDSRAAPGSSRNPPHPQRSAARNATVAPQGEPSSGNNVDVTEDHPGLIIDAIA